jgi:hypothetical protein
MAGGACFRVNGRSNSADERDEADGGGGGNVGWINQQQEDVID